MNKFLSWIYVMSFVIFDTEYTSRAWCQENGWKGNQKKEIVQISAVKLSNDLNVIDEFNILCRPVINPILSDYFVKLTHITNDKIINIGIPFSECYKKFESFVENNICYSHKWWSDYFDESDGAILKENLLLNNMSEDKKIIYRNIAPIFAKLYRENNIKVQTQTSGQIVQNLGIEKNMEHLNLDIHNAFYDVYSILEWLKYFYPESIKLLSSFQNSAKQS